MHFFNPDNIPIVFKGPTYDSAPHTPNFFSRAFPTLSFYLRMYLEPTLWSVIKAKRGRFDDKAWLHSAHWVLEVVERSGIHVHVDGMQYLDEMQGKPCVICANHMSTLETYLTPAIFLPRFPVTFVVKKYLVEMPLFCDIMKSRDPVVLGRTNPREDLMKVLNEGGERIRRGMSVVVFPQGTRCNHFDDAKFNSLAVKLAVKAGVPLIPLALKTNAWSVGKKLKEFGPVYPNRDVLFRFFPPVNIKGSGHAEHRAITETLRSTLAFWEKRQEVLDRHALPYEAPDFRLPAAIDPAARAAEIEQKKAGLAAEPAADTASEETKV